MEEIIVDAVGKYNSFETLLTVTPQEAVQLVLYYDLPQELSISSENRKYQLYWQKQRGTTADPVTFRFEPPFGLRVNGQAQVLEENRLDTDKVFTISIVN